MTAAYDHRNDTTLHTTCESAETGRVVDFVKAHEQKHGTLPPAKFYLSGPEPGERVELTKDLFEMLKAAASHLRAGRTASLTAQDQEITTQQAAD